MTETKNPLRFDIPVPTGRLARLYVDHRGYPVPWFVAWVDGVPDHRIMDAEKKEKAFVNQLCWICGQPLGGATVTYAIGPMCAVNRISAEPPSHKECAEYSVRACPFLSRPHAHRREGGLPDEAEEPDGIMVRRNPGVILVWTAKKYTTRIVPAGDGTLFHVGDPYEISWFCQGRAATREEVEDAIRSGIPILQEVAEEQGGDALRRLSEQLAIAWELVP